MKIVIDTNVLFSALLKDSLTRRLILEYEDKFLFPIFIFEEMRRHQAHLLAKSRMEETDFSKLLDLLLRKVIVVPTTELRTKEKEAKALAQDIDPDDAIFFACALAHDATIWSDDKALKGQDKVSVITTKEMKELLA